MGPGPLPPVASRLAPVSHWPSPPGKRCDGWVPLPRPGDASVMEISPRSSAAGLSTMATGETVGWLVDAAEMVETYLPAIATDESLCVEESELKGGRKE